MLDAIVTLLWIIVGILITVKLYADCSIDFQLKLQDFLNNLQEWIDQMWFDEEVRKRNKRK